MDDTRHNSGNATVEQQVLPSITITRRAYTGKGDNRAFNQQLSGQRKRRHECIESNIAHDSAPPAHSFINVANTIYEELTTPIALSSKTMALVGRVVQEKAEEYVRILDPLWFDLQSNNSLSLIDNVCQGTILLIPIHHKRNGRWSLLSLEVTRINTVCRFYDPIRSINTDALLLERTLVPWLQTQGLGLELVLSNWVSQMSFAFREQIC